MDYDNLDDFLSVQGMDFTFAELLEQLQNGTKEGIFEILEYFGKIFLGNFHEIKGQLLQLLGICIMFSIVVQLSKAYGKESIGKYGSYIYFLCASTVCLNLFTGGYETVYRSINGVIQFMEVLMPTYAFALVMTNGINTSGAYYGMALLILFLTEIILCVFFLPGTKIYMAMRFVNQGVGENFFSKIIKLFEDVFSWGLKIMLVAVCSINTLQGLLFPAVDKVRRISVGKAMSMIPGIGSLSGSAAEVLLSSTTLLKNSVGIAAVVILILLCIPAIMKLTVLILGVRLLEACLEPVLGQKSVELMGGCHLSIRMLWKVQIHTLTIFALSLVIITALS